MTRSRKTARAAGTSFETWIRDWFRDSFGTRAVERRARTGAKDEGDIAGVSCHAGPVVIEAKNVARMNLSGWVDEADVERGNADAAIGVVIHKRVGRGRERMGEQYVTLTLHDFTVLLGGTPPPR